MSFSLFELRKKVIDRFGFLTSFRQNVFDLYIFSLNIKSGFSCKNDQFYVDGCKGIVLSSLEGINGTIFMYG